MENVGNFGMIFGTREEILEAHPNDGVFVNDKSLGVIGDAIVLKDGTQCISIYLGNGRSTLITSMGVPLGDETNETPIQTRVEGGAWIPKKSYDIVVHVFRLAAHGYIILTDKCSV